jgi:hypothetical protein
MQYTGHFLNLTPSFCCLFLLLYVRPVSGPSEADVPSRPSSRKTSRGVQPSVGSCTTNYMHKGDFIFIRYTPCANTAKLFSGCFVAGPILLSANCAPGSASGQVLWVVTYPIWPLIWTLVLLTSRTAKLHLHRAQSVIDKRTEKCVQKQFSVLLVDEAEGCMEMYTQALTFSQQKCILETWRLPVHAAILLHSLPTFTTCYTSVLHGIDLQTGTHKIGTSSKV